MIITSGMERTFNADRQWRKAGPLAAWCGGQICRPIVLEMDSLFKASRTNA